MDVRALQEEPTVLVVEDNSELRALYSVWLDDSYRVIEAKNCSTAYEHFADDVDVVLLDRDLPDGSGDEILTRIREMELGWGVAIVSAIEPTLADLEMAFDEYLHKPPERDEIRSTVERLYLRSQIGDHLDEFYSLSAKKRMLERYYPSHELLSDEKYARLESRLEELYCMLKHSSTVMHDSTATGA